MHPSSAEGIRRQQAGGDVNHSLAYSVSSSASSSASSAAASSASGSLVTPQSSVSVSAKYVQRFREGKPAPKEERERVDPAEFWWIARSGERVAAPPLVEREGDEEDVEDEDEQEEGRDRHDNSNRSSSNSSNSNSSSNASSVSGARVFSPSSSAEEDVGSGGRRRRLEQGMGMGTGRGEAGRGVVVESWASIGDDGHAVGVYCDDAEDDDDDDDDDDDNEEEEDMDDYGELDATPHGGEGEEDDEEALFSAEQLLRRCKELLQEQQQQYPVPEAHTLSHRARYLPGAEMMVERPLLSSLSPPTASQEPRGVQQLSAIVRPEPQLQRQSGNSANSETDASRATPVRADQHANGTENSKDSDKERDLSPEPLPKRVAEPQQEPALAPKAQAELAAEHQHQQQQQQQQHEPASLAQQLHVTEVMDESDSASRRKPAVCGEASQENTEPNPMQVPTQPCSGVVGDKDDSCSSTRLDAVLEPQNASLETGAAPTPAPPPTNIAASTRRDDITSPAAIVVEQHDPVLVCLVDYRRRLRDELIRRGGGS